MRGLYAIVDLTVLERAKLGAMAFAEAVLEARPAAVQLRAKNASARETLELLRALRPLASSSGTLLFANDRADLALLAGCDGVHLGQRDLPAADARQLASQRKQSLSIGVSSHDDRELGDALASPVDYVAIGPVFGTTSKAEPEPTLGLDGALSLAAKARAIAPGMPLVAIGGIDASQVASLAGAFDMVAVISALVPAWTEGTSVGDRLDDARDRARLLVASSNQKVPS